MQQRRRFVAVPAIGALAATRPSAIRRAALNLRPVPLGVQERFAGLLAGHHQAVVAVGRDVDSAHVTVADWTRTRHGWTRIGQWTGHNGVGGWSTHHRAGDLRTPVGVYSLTNAGGYLPDPGTRLPYQHDPAYYALVTRGVRTFDYVVGINYDHMAGTPPSDPRRPLGAGGGIWLHVDHGSATHACVTIPRRGLETTLRWLRPAAHPVILMGPRSIICAP